MKQYYTKIVSLILGTALLSLFMITAASARTPTLTVATTAYNAVQVTVYGDPNAAILLDYYSSGQLLGAGTIGYTNYSGYFSGQLNPGWYNIPNGSQVVVVVNGKQSNAVTWYVNSTYYNPPIINPYPYSYQSWLSLSNTNVQLTVGSVGSVAVYGATNLYMPNTYNNGVAAGTVNGAVVTIYGIAPGSTTLQVCQIGTGRCASIYVTVTNPSNYYYNSQYYYPPMRNGDWYYSYIDDRWHHH